MSAELTIDDIVDLRAYEREREVFRPRIIELKKKRRVHVGTFMTLVFENRDTIRFQVQEMARIEKITTDAGIDTELRTYNPLISRPGRLSATLFLELTTEEQLREWLPKLAGVEWAIALHIGEGDNSEIIANNIDLAHDDALTRPDTTSAVHYLWWPLSAAQVERLATEPVKIICTHPAYLEEMQLSEENRAQVVADLR
ncbi:MAG: DUF3501 family protein [Acidimicrobiia bacterium]|nr:DUF3501 family protein [Acidimicrobiia bacterium]